MIVRHVRTTRAVARAGFTLMEVLVVVAILVILAGVGSVVVFRYLDESKENAARLQIANIETAVQAFRISEGDYPPDLATLTQPLEGKPAALEQSSLVDPWKHPFVYERENRHPLTGKPLIYSLGMNPGNPNGRIMNWSSGPGH